ncbi:hypothetical protein E4P41_11625 [Geodermatophilus sp. DF01-2]|uniref:hypothetical protein n=1 Tax=Geodermatophilus sp. DF01-2 TaxID=2559610 RepID=UPI0010734D9C|nr:hypothetical protein [Geodermatophilus sp. DF01_2]TFV59560.1 hypothetical protein E4P41_11625 [Geodermatophilus sp. DF01_2]
MGSDLGNGFAAYPMVEEGEATGVVAAVYAQLLDRMPFVPSLFKSLALSPGYLVLAHEQAAAVLPDETFRSLAQQLSSSVGDAVTPPADQPVREALARFTEPLSRMLLLTAGLLLALDDELDRPPAPGRAPEPRVVEPRQPAPSQWDAPAPQLYGEIRAALETPMVNSIWRALAGQGLLETAWSALRPQVGGSRPAADEVQRRAFEAARQVPWQVAATPAALDRAGLADVRPGVASVLDAYAKTLPRVLVLVSSSTGGG